MTLTDAQLRQLSLELSDDDAEPVLVGILWGENVVTALLEEVMQSRGLEPEKEPDPDTMETARTTVLCGTHETSVYSRQYDAHYCPVCNAWLQSRCWDENCPHCPGRPEKPLARDPQPV